MFDIMSERHMVLITIYVVLSLIAVALLLWWPYK
jgi:hypothetical protein